MNNNNISFCVIASIFIGASFLTMLSCKKCKPFVDYENSLDQEQSKLYDKIVKERQNIYIKAFIMGSIVAFVYLWIMKKNINPLLNSCTFTAIAMFTQYIVYTLHQKSDYMILHLNNKQQREKWLDVYKTMKNRYHFGMVMGLIGYFLLSFGLSKR